MFDILVNGVLFTASFGLEIIEVFYDFENGTSLLVVDGERRVEVSLCLEGVLVVEVVWEKFFDFLVGFDSSQFFALFSRILFFHLALKVELNYFGLF